MDMHTLAARGVMLLGCGKMGSAMLAGWLAEGLPPTAVSVVDPAPSEWLRGTGVALGLPDAAPGIVIVAVKPQMMGAALPVLAAWGAGDTVFVS
ncbi:MAG: NAD(P)-binding domain-containing protein, partial [Pseudomonadota bacterium]